MEDVPRHGRKVISVSRKQFSQNSAKIFCKKLPKFREKGSSFAKSIQFILLNFCSCTQAAAEGTTCETFRPCLNGTRGMCSVVGIFTTIVRSKVPNLQKQILAPITHALAICMGSFFWRHGNSPNEQSPSVEKSFKSLNFRPILI